MGYQTSFIFFLFNNLRLASAPTKSVADKTRSLARYGNWVVYRRGLENGRLWRNLRQYPRMCTKGQRQLLKSFIMSQNVHRGAQEAMNIVYNIPECAWRSRKPWISFVISQNVHGGAEKPRKSSVISQNVDGGAQEAMNIVCNIPECARRCRKATKIICNIPECERRGSGSHEYRL